MTTRRDVLQVGACVTASVAAPAVMAVAGKTRTLLILVGSGGLPGGALET
jgi:hypothetical protein